MGVGGKAVQDPDADSEALNIPDNLFAGSILRSEFEVNDDDRHDYAALDRALELHKEGVDGRNKYAPRLYKLTVWWIVAVLVLVIAAGFRLRVLGRDFILSDGVLMTLVGSTTATVLGLFAIVTRYYFSNGQDSSDES